MMAMARRLIARTLVLRAGMRAKSHMSRRPKRRFEAEALRGETLR